MTLPVSDPLPLPDGSNLAYLEQRGFDADICKYFELRWCQFGWWKFKDPDGNTQTQNFGDRVIIPVFDLDGTLKTFQGRDLTGEFGEEVSVPDGAARNRPLPSGTVITPWRPTMCAWARALSTWLQSSLPSMRIRNCAMSCRIGSFGKHLSYGAPDGDDQLGRFLKLKARGVTTVTIMWDGEINALLAALDAAKVLSGIGMKVRIALLPFEKDPNEVTGDVTRKAFYAAQLWTPALDIRWRLRNPYAEDAKKKAAAAKE
ncbi:hypothetical protein U8P73_36710 (plasmid) [Rhizobium beringeri]|uniref:hypothetical protein n=1 Tax=Rhizobium beringeri TaxID=3019934 RepID=UPI002DDD6470|nr:hypothetical protein [Rhizobium beringeri]WSG93515.1 hypothetical protein U8P73_36710 [Rhizobium beringeri]